MALLSHYTSEAGLIGIVRSQTLWATEFLSLNDDSEFVYALRALYEKALADCFAAIPTDLRDPAKSDAELAAIPGQIIAALKEQIRTSDGYGSLYVVSFARGRNDDEDARGILSLWARYTDNCGYCLQFDEADIRSLLDHELLHGSFASLSLAEVTYGIDTNEREFRALAEQLTLRLRDYLFHAHGDTRLAPDVQRLKPDSVFAKALLEFCATHKDPAFGDEREIRIFAYPVNVTAARPFAGFSRPKPIGHRGNRANGPRHLVLGENLLPGFIPWRLLGAPKADLPPWKLQALYPAMPGYQRSTIPLA